MKRLLATMLLALCLSGCGTAWEHFWGQDTHPETRYIPMTPDQFERSIGPVLPFQWGDSRFVKARYLSIWACRSDNVCTGLPQVNADNNSLVFYVVDARTSVMTITGLDLLRIGGIAPTKVRFQVVM